MNCLIFVFTSTILIGSLSADPVVLQPLIIFNQSHINFFEQCKTVTGDDTIIQRIEATATEYELCENLSVSTFFDTIKDYIKGIANETTDTKNVIVENCPKVRNGLDCTTKFVNNASMCYKNNDHTKMLTQIEAIRGIIDYLCADEGQNIIKMKEADRCLEENEVSLSQCFGLEDADEEETINVDIAYSPINFESKTECRLPKQKDCIIKSVNCTAASFIGTVIDVLTPLIISGCP